MVAAKKAEVEALHQQAEQNRRAALEAQKNNAREQAAYQRAIAEQKALLMRSPSSATGKPAYPLQEALPLAQGPNTAAAGVAQDRPAGPSNDPAPPAITTTAANNPSLTLGTPYVNPRIAAHPQPRVGYPIWDPTTGVRPAIRTTRKDEHISEWEASAMQECRVCDEHSSTRRCPGFRKLGSQGVKHNKATYATATCYQTGCEAPLCGQHMFPRDKGSDDKCLKSCGECIETRARCTVCGFGHSLRR